jgi:hypothetical protein
MVVREPNGEPKLLMILAMAGLCEASRDTGRRIRPRADPRRPCWQGNADSRGGVPARTPCSLGPASRAGEPEPGIEWADGSICSRRRRPRDA